MQTTNNDWRTVADNYRLGTYYDWSGKVWVTITGPPEPRDSEFGPKWDIPARNRETGEDLILSGGPRMLAQGRRAWMDAGIDDPTGTDWTVWREGEGFGTKYGWVHRPVREVD